MNDSVSFHKFFHSFFEDFILFIGFIGEEFLIFFHIFTALFEFSWGTGDFLDGFLLVSSEESIDEWRYVRFAQGYVYGSFGGDLLELLDGEFVFLDGAGE